MENIHRAVDEMVDDAATLLVQDMSINMRTVEHWARRIKSALLYYEVRQEIEKEKRVRFFGLLTNTFTLTPRLFDWQQNHPKRLERYWKILEFLDKYIFRCRAYIICQTCGLIDFTLHPPEDKTC